MTKQLARTRDRSSQSRLQSLFRGILAVGPIVLVLCGCRPALESESASGPNPRPVVVPPDSDRQGIAVVSENLLEGRVLSGRFAGIIDSGQVRTFEGPIIDRDVVEHEDQGKLVFVELLLDSGENATAVLGPEGFLDANRIRTGITNKLRVTGPTVIRRGPFVVANEVSSRGRTLELRSQRGRPLWFRR